MILAKNNPVGLDVVIDRIQKAVDKAFDVKWSEGQNTTGGVKCYPRCYVNEKLDYRVIEFFDSSTRIDYLEAVGDKVNSMVVVNEYDINKISINVLKTKLDLIFIVNLKETHPTVTHRADEEVRSEVLKIIEKIPNTTVESVVRGLKKIFKDIKYDNKIDMHPMHCFKVVLSVDRFLEDEKIC